MYALKYLLANLIFVTACLGVIGIVGFLVIVLPLYWETDRVQ